MCRWQDSNSGASTHFFIIITIITIIITTIIIIIIIFFFFFFFTSFEAFRVLQRERVSAEFDSVRARMMMQFGDLPHSLQREFKSRKPGPHLRRS
jgi:flagellar basal body-associated protein FliL